MEFLFFNPFRHNREGFEQWKRGFPSFRGFGISKPSRLIDYVLTLEEKVLGHFLVTVPDKNGVSGTLAKVPSYVNVVHFTTVGDGECWFVSGDKVEILCPCEQRQIEVESPLAEAIISLILCYTKE